MFRFEAIWAKEVDCSNIIDEVWSSGDEYGSIRNIMSLITECGFHLTQ